jgi:hypothetical protein
MARDSIKPSKNPDGSVTYRVEDPPEGHIAAVTVGKDGDGSYWAVIEFRRGLGLEQCDGIAHIGRSRY